MYNYMYIKLFKTEYLCAFYVSILISETDSQESNWTGHVYKAL